MRTSPLLPATLLALIVLWAAPFQVQAFGISSVFGAASGVPVNDGQNTIWNTLDKVIQKTAQAAEVAQKVNAYVLEPLAFVVSGDILKAITEGVVSFVVGEANGTGIPQFVVDVQESLRTVSDSQALAFLRDYDRYSGSPFASSIGSALEDDYLSKTSLRAFWERNMNTLRQSSALYSDAYLYGDWSRGGLHSWFALTTRYENNPYMQYERAQRQLANLIGPGVGGATGARLEELQWGNGFMSWCGDTENEGLFSGFGDDYSLLEEQVSSNPGDPCMKDGKKKKIQTPGTVIAAALNRAFQNEQEKIVRMGNVGPQLTQILNNLATVYNTARFAESVLGGEGSRGLIGLTKTSATSATSPLSSHTQTQGSFGATYSGVLQSAADSEETAALVSRMDQYEDAWRSVESAAQEATAAVTELATVCPSLTNETATAQTTIINPVTTEASSALTRLVGVRTQLAEAQSRVEDASATNTSGILAEIQALQNGFPTEEDLGTAIQLASVTEGAAASPEGSLSVSGGSAVDQMNLLRTNAVTLKVGCGSGSQSPDI